MGIDDIIIAFLRKEPLCRGKVRSNGFKLFVEDTCIGQWRDHRVVMNDTSYNTSIKKCQDLLFKWLQQSDIIFNVVGNVPQGKQQLTGYC